jgi:hypothetical protein
MVSILQGEKHQSERQCAVTRLRLNSGELLRFALDPDGYAVPDLKARLPGRGVWITCTREIVEKAIASHAFDRGFRRSVKTADGLTDQVESLLERDALQRLALANKAGLVVSGFDKVSKVLKKGNAAYIVHASDAAPDGCRKLDGLFRANESGPESTGSSVRGLNAEQLSLALGRPNVIHAALKQGVPSDKFLSALVRLERFRAGSAVNVAA